jgi:hypothetical protein
VDDRPTLTLVRAEALDRIRAWGEARDWRGYDPYDALNSPLAPMLTLGLSQGRRVFTQVVKRSPLNLRPLLRIRPELNAKAVALVASGYARLGAARDDHAALAAATSWLDWLVGHSSSEVGLGWGYHFDVETRFFGYARETPNVIATSFAAHALLDGSELIGDASWGDAAAQACEFLVSALLVEEPGRTYFRYLPAEGELVHNANVLGCSVLARTATVLQRPDIAEPVQSALASTLTAQRLDGSWPYSEGGSGRDWVDNFHTGYVLEGLAMCEAFASEAVTSLERGLVYWEQNLFLADGTPRYTSRMTYPVDAHNYAQAIETWLAVTPHWADRLERAERCAALLVQDLLNSRGHVDFQRHRHWRNRVPFVRWTTAPAFRALARLELARKGQGARLD